MNSNPHNLGYGEWFDARDQLRDILRVVRTHRDRLAESDTFTVRERNACTALAEQAIAFQLACIAELRDDLPTVFESHGPPQIRGFTIGAQLDALLAWTDRALEILTPSTIRLPIVSEGGADARFLEWWVYTNPGVNQDDLRKELRIRKKEPSDWLGGVKDHMGTLTSKYGFIHQSGIGYFVSHKAMKVFYDEGLEAYRHLLIDLPEPRVKVRERSTDGRSSCR